MSHDPLGRIPTSITAGDTVAWTVPQKDFPPGTWTLAYRLTSLTTSFLVANSEPNITIADVGDGTWLVTLTPAFTATLPDDTRLAYYGWVTDGAAEYEIDRGEIFVRFDPRTATSGFEFRSHARIALEAIEAVMEGKATADQLSYSIAGRSLSRYDWSDLQKMRDYYRAEVANEEARERARKGLPSKSLVGVSFRSPS